MTYLAKVAAGSALFVAAILSPTRAYADPYEAALTRAVAAKERALDVNEPARWQEALTLFQEVDAQRSTVETMYEIGFAAERLRQADLAVEAYETALTLGLSGTAGERARAFVAEHEPSMGRLDVRGPEGLAVSVNDLPRGRLPLGRPLVVFAGPQKISLTFSDGKSTSRLIRVDAGKVIVVEAPTPPPDPPSASPARNAAPTRRDATPAPARARTRPTTVGWTLFGGGLVTATAGGVLAFVSGSNIDSARAELEESCDVPAGPDACRNAEPGRTEDAQREVDRIATWKAVRTGSWVAAGAGVVAAGAGLVLLTTDIVLVAGPEPRGVRLGAAGVF